MINRTESPALPHPKHLKIPLAGDTINEGVFSFYRHSENQRKILTERGYALRTYCTASVKFEFFTKGGELSFGYIISKGTNRSYYSIDLFEDGVYKFSISEEKDDASGEFSYEIPESDVYKKITVYSEKIEILDDKATTTWIASIDGVLARIIYNSASDMSVGADVLFSVCSVSTVKQMCNKK